MVKIPYILILSAILISFNLSACSSILGNVVPKSGPSMEKVYDSMSNMNKQKNGQINEIKDNNITIDGYSSEQQGLKNFRQNQIKINPIALNFDGLRESPTTHFGDKFHKIPNPELHLYIYPHLAGTDQIPIPGYMTVFNVYERDHYALTNS